jgi:hypothetical protein
VGVSASAATLTGPRVSDVAVLVLQAANKLVGTVVQQTSK